MDDQSSGIKGREKVSLPDKDNLAEQTLTLLWDLNLLPSADDLKSAGLASAAVKGTPDSVSVLEAGATAATKGWAALGTGVAAGMWASVGTFWKGNKDVHAPILWGASIISAAIILGIAYLFASDVRGRATATVETIRARNDIARAMINAALQHTDDPPVAAPAPAVVSLPRLDATKTVGADSEGWHAIAMIPDVDAAKIRYLLVKDGESVWVGAADLIFT